MSEHGKRSTYAMGCRCLLCKAANDQYEYERVRGKRYMVGEAECELARRRVARWRRQGIGLRRIELVTGVSRSSLRCLIDGNGTNNHGMPSKRMKKENFEAIMRAKIKRGVLVDGLPRLDAHGAVLEPWQWAECETDFRAGVDVDVLASRYGLKPDSIRKHMIREGIKPTASASGLCSFDADTR